MHGTQIAGWKCDVGNFLDTLDPVLNNIPDVWNQFLHEFTEQYQDSQKENQARAQLKNCHMKFPEIDDYISQFKELCHNTGYTPGNNEVFHLFIKGLPNDIMEAIFISPIPADYWGLKDKAIKVTQSRMLVKGFLKTRGQLNPGGFNQGGTNSFQQLAYQPNQPFQGRRPGFFSGNQGGQGNLFNQQCSPGFHPQGGGQARPQYNSTNAPRWMANQPVPMDLDCACAQNRNWCRQGHGQSRSNAPTTEPPCGMTNNTCFECRQTGHFARNCLCCHQGRTGANLIDFNDKFNSYEELEPVDQVAQMWNQLNMMTLDDKARLAKEMEVAEDFPTA